LLEDQKTHHSSKTAKTYLYIGNLGLTITDEDLRRLFGAYGQVLSVNIMNDAYIGSRQPRAYAYVEMALKSQCEAAVHELDGKKLGGRPISVVEALPISHITKTPCRHSKYRQR
jgi:RNA recognition motif-containing protein